MWTLLYFITLSGGIHLLNMFCKERVHILLDIIKRNTGFYNICRLLGLGGMD